MSKQTKNEPFRNISDEEKRPWWRRFAVEEFLVGLVIIIGYLFTINNSLGKLEGRVERGDQAVTSELEAIKAAFVRLEERQLGLPVTIPTPTKFLTTTFIYNQEGPLDATGNTGIGRFIADDFFKWSSSEAGVRVLFDTGLDGVNIDLWSGDLETAYVRLFGGPCGMPETGEYTALQARRDDFEACPLCNSCAVYIAYPSVEGEIARNGFIVPKLSYLRLPLASWMGNVSTIEIFREFDLASDL